MDSPSDPHQLPPYLRPHSYPAGGHSYGYYYPPSSSQPSAMPMRSREDNGNEPPRKRMASTGAGYCPPPHSLLFRPVDFDAPAINARLVGGHSARRMPVTPTGSSNCSEEDNWSHEASGTHAVMGKDSTYSRGGITIGLQEADLWHSFASVGNEMIVTKPGRRMFPSLLASIRGLELNASYSISLGIKAADKYRYKFLGMRWVPMGESEIVQDESRQVYHHPNSPKSGAFWMKKPISFKPCKITHNTHSKHGNILLHTMHKYVLSIIVNKIGIEESETVIVLTATEFITVTAYQNSKLTLLKINNNPFAKGFRERELLPGWDGGSVAMPSIHPGWLHPSMLGYQQELPSVASFTPSDSASSPSPDQSISPTPAHGHAHDFMPLTYPYVLSRDQNTTTPTMMSELTEEIPESP